MLYVALNEYTNGWAFIKGKTAKNAVFQILKELQEQTESSLLVVLLRKLKTFIKKNRDLENL